MDEDLSSFAQGNTDFDLGPVSHDVEAEDAADVLKREKQFDEDLENAFNDLSDDDDEEVNETSEDDSDDPGASGEESDHSHHNKSEVDVEQSSIKKSYEYSEQPNQHSVLIRREFPAFEQHSTLTDSEVVISKTSDANCSRISDANCSNISDENYSQDEERYENHSRNLDVNHSENAVVNDPNFSNFSHSYASDVDQSNVYSVHRTENHMNYDNISEHKSDVISKSRTIHSFPKGDSNEPEIYDQYDYGGVSRITYPSQINNQTELYEEYKKLQSVNKAICEELKQVNTEAIRARENFEREIQSLKSRLKYIEVDKEKLVASLQEAQNTISDIKHDYNTVNGEFAALKIRLSEEQKARETAQAKFESAEITIQSLEQQIKHTQPDNVRRLEQQNENIIKDLKLRHQKELLKHKEDIDKLRENYNTKIIESDNLSAKLSQQQKNFEERMERKDKSFNALSAKLEACEKECNELREGNIASEVYKLRLQVEVLEKGKLELEKQNSDLKDEVKSLQRQSEACETITLALRKKSLSEKNNKDQNSHDESNLKEELQKCHQINHSLQNQNYSMKKKLEDLMHELSVKEEKLKLVEILHKESEAKIKELEKKLEEVLPYGSIPASQHEKKVNSLESELAECDKKLRDLAERFKALSSRESVLQEENERLKNSIIETSKKHAEEKNMITEVCRKRYQEALENAIKKCKQEFTSEKKVICYDYENRIAELEREIQDLKDDLYSARSGFVKISDENKSLQLKIDSMSQVKEREEIEREIRLAYEKKLNKMKEQIQKEKTEFESNLKSETEKTQVEWTKQKMAQVEKFVNQTKDMLDAEFVKCLNEKKQILEAEKSKILDECQEKINSLQRKYETEKSNLHVHFQRKWDSEMTKLHQDHQAEIESITERFEKKIASLENEIKVLQEKSNYDLELKAETELLHSDLKHQYEEEKKNYEAKLKESYQKKWKNETKELQQNYQKEVESLKKSYQDKIVTLEDEIKILKENLLKASNSGEMQILKEEYNNAKLALDTEKLDLLKNEHLLKSKLSTAVEVEKKLLEKNKKLKKYIVNLQKTHKEKSGILQKENEELKKSIIDKENELQLVKTEYDSCKRSLEEKHQKHHPIKNSACQTEKEVVPKEVLKKIYDLLAVCLKTISDKVNTFLTESRKRNAEHLKKALSFYHDHLTSKISQELWKDARSISPNFGIPRVNRHLKSAASSSDNVISPDVMQHPLISNCKISNSTPADMVTSGNTHKNLEFQMNNISNVRAFQNIKSPPDFANGFADMSFDFVPIKMSDFEHTSVKLPQYSMPRGLFHEENIFNSHTQS